MKILIASPSYDGSVRREYMKAVLELTETLRQQGIAWSLLIEPATILHTMRSVMASQALLDADCTHLLFIDTDLAFSSSTIERLISANTDVIGCAYPYRTIPLDQAPASGAASLRQAISSAVPYALRFRAGIQSVAVNNGLCEVAGIGTGLLLIRRQALEKLVQSGTVKTYQTGFPYSQWFQAPTYYGFFDHLEVDGVQLGEDYSFCQRWTHTCGGTITALVDQEVGHIGPVAILGRYTDRLRAGQL